MSSNTAATASPLFRAPGRAPGTKPLRTLLTSAAVSLALLAVVWGALTLAGQTFRSSDRVSESFSRLQEVRIDTSFEAVEVIGSTSATEVTVERTWSWSLRRPKTSIVQAGTALTVASRCPFTPGPECRGTVTVVVPANLALSLATGDGRLQVHDITGPVKATTDDGDVIAAELAGPFTVTTTDGSIAATELRSTEVSLSTADGDVRLSFVRAPSRITAQTQDGDVQIELPTDGSPYAISAETADGARTVSVPTDPNSPRHVKVRAGDGAIHIAPTQ